ncbi:MAG: HAD-IIB family hydrolase [Patescibacteria group bacterium]|mgnify:CR=1 FL=1
MRKLVIFDLDGTLTESKANLTADVSSALCDLLSKTKVAVISGGSLPQYKKQFIAHLACPDKLLSNLILLPTNGSEMFVYSNLDHEWKSVYNIYLTDLEKIRIKDALKESLSELGSDKLENRPEKIFGELTEDRGSEITFSALGQSAPVELKKAWDPDRSKRLALASALEARVPEFEITVGGATSVDITKKGINKAFAIDQLSDHLHIPKNDMIYVGDALFEGGNDYLAKRAGIECIAVLGPVDTLRVIGELLEHNEDS